MIPPPVMTIFTVSSLPPNPVVKRTVSPVKGPAAATSVTAGRFERIYDPSVGEPEAWYINDHTFVRDETGTWHLIGITHAEPAAPHDELHLAHATAPALPGPWTKQPFALSTDRAAGEFHLWAPHVIRHDGRYWMFVCAGGPSPSEYRIHLAVSDDCTNWQRHPANPMVVDGYEARDPMVVPVGDRRVMYYTATTEPVDLIVQQSRMRDGSRKITAITEVQGMEGDMITLQDVFTFEQESFEGGKVIGRIKPNITLAGVSGRRGQGGPLQLDRLPRHARAAEPRSVPVRPRRPSRFPRLPRVGSGDRRSRPDLGQPLRVEPGGRLPGPARMERLTRLSHSSPRGTPAVSTCCTRRSTSAARA